ncbi:MAG: hypothetical protein PVI90_01380 [Desulfobacteraceae bacterium]
MVFFTHEPKRYWGLEECYELCIFVTNTPPGRQQAPNLSVLLSVERGNPVRLPYKKGRRTVRNAHDRTGLGCPKKRMPCCNGADMTRI